ncbi:MAG: cadherin-like domain-containing protein, partial [Sulfurimonas sp.]|nr:cadherin-like domain-containing protein [Sulfurimonas sp.]
DYTTTVQADGTYSVDVAGADLAADTSFNVNVVSTDSLGNEVTSSATSTHTVDTSADNEAPTAENDSVTTNEDESYTLTTDDFGYSDGDGDALSSVIITDLPVSGSLILNGNAVSAGDEIGASDISSGNLIFIPASNSDVNVSFDFKVSDGTDWSSEATTTITVNAVADATTLSVTLGSPSDITTTVTNNTSTTESNVEVKTKDNDIKTEDKKTDNDEVEVKLDANQTTESMNIEFDHFKNSEDGDITIQAYDEAGNTVGDPLIFSGFNDDHKHILEFNPANVDGFHSIKITAESDTDIKVKKITADVTTESESTTTEVTAHSYELDITTALTDTDGSEVLSITVSGLPDGATLINTAGDTIIVSSGGATLTSEQLDGLTLVATTEVTEDFNLNIVATSTDGSSTATTMSTVIVDVDDGLVAGETINMSDTKDESATAGDGDDVINMGDGKDQLAYGEAGDDTINMGDGKSAKGQEAHGGDGDDTINIDGKDFAAYGEAGDDTFNVSSDDFKSGKSGKSGEGDFDGKDSLIDGGEGLDSLVFGDEMNIDFSALDDNISNIEVIDLGAGAQNVTSLGVDDVLTMTDDDNILRIDGDGSDHIDLNTTGGDAEWTLGAFKTDAETGQEYQEVTGQVDGNDVTLEISSSITIDES